MSNISKRSIPTYVVHTCESS